MFSYNFFQSYQCSLPPFPFSPLVLSFLPRSRYLQSSFLGALLYQLYLSCPHQLSFFSFSDISHYSRIYIERLRAKIPKQQNMQCLFFESESPHLVYYVSGFNHFPGKFMNLFYFTTNQHFIVCMHYIFSIHSLGEYLGCVCILTFVAMNMTEEVICGML